MSSLPSSRKEILCFVYVSTVSTSPTKVHAPSACFLGHMPAFSRVGRLLFGPRSARYERKSERRKMRAAQGHKWKSYCTIAKLEASRHSKRFLKAVCFGQALEEAAD